MLFNKIVLNCAKGFSPENIFNMKKRNLEILLVLIALLSIQVIFAQDGVKPPEPGDGKPGVPGLPIDSLLWIGSLFAVFYGSIKTYLTQKNNNYESF